MQQCVFGPHHTLKSDPTPRLLERQSQLARLLHDSTEDKGGLRLVSNLVELELLEFCMREMKFQHGHRKDPAGISERLCTSGNLMGGIKATFLALHICEETHLYGFYLRALTVGANGGYRYDLDADDTGTDGPGDLHSGDAQDFPYSYYQPSTEGKDTWHHPSHSALHDFGLNELLIRRLMALGHVQLHY